MQRLRFWVLAAFAAAALLLTSTAGAGVAGARTHARHVRGAAARQQAFHRLLRRHARAAARRARAAGVNSTAGDSDLAEQAEQYGFERTAPARTVSGQAMLSAAQQSQGLDLRGGPWQEVTTQPYNAQPADYTDPFWSNVGAGFSLVGGRTTALAQTPDGTWYAGAADGGVWRSSDQGGHWAPVSDFQPSLSIGALAVDPVDGSLWVGTGEANTNSDAYDGTGVYRYGGHGSGLQLVGGSADSNPIVSRTIYALTFDPSGNAYAATSNGLFRYDVGADHWSEVLAPAGPDPGNPYDNHVTSVAVVPGSHGQDVIAAVGWRGAADPNEPSEGLEHNGFYSSTDGGHTFAEISPTGQIDAADIGRTTFAYSADGHKLYAIVESPAKLAAGDETSLQGIFVASGSPASVAGPWTKIGDEAKLAASGSALAVNSGYGVGIQSWYNQDLAVDPSDDNHVYAGLEEVFESTDGGGHWVTASPYWNYGLPCSKTAAGCPNTTHPDQHALMIADGKVIEGNDGGVYSRPLADTQQYGDWSDLNATYRSWQYYDARAGSLDQAGAYGNGRGQGGGAVGVWGGLQDNGTSVLDQGQPQMVEPSGGDGFDVIVDPSNATRMVGEYTEGAMYSSTDNGHSFNSDVSPGCAAQATVNETPMADCDPAMRFITPLVPDGQDTDTWLTGGQYVWISRDGWSTSCTSETQCSWKAVYDTGAGNAVTALASARGGRVVYAAYVSGGGNPGPSFGRGIATNVGGTWHTVDTSGLPNRFIAGMTVDPSRPTHAYAIFNGFSRRWIPGGGVGHVYETWDGGRSWQDISGNLPDVGGDALVLQRGTLALATDLGVYTAQAGRGSQTRWSRLGSGLPNASVNDLTPGPNGYVYAATHGRGIWRVRLNGGGH